MNNLKVGYAKNNINPPLGIAVCGYYIDRFAKGFVDDLEVHAMVLTDGKTDIAMVGVDICYMVIGLVDRIRAQIEAQTGIKQENIYLNATHTHTGPDMSYGGMSADCATNALTVRYTEFLITRIADAVKLAQADVKPARMGFCVGYAPERVAYIRRYKMKDGSTMTCPPINDPNIDYPLGKLDQRVNVLRFDREGGCSVVLVNYGVHADTVNGELICSDFPGWMRKTLAAALDGTACMFFPGAQGDVGSTHVNPAPGDMNDTEISFDNEMKSPGMARFVGRALAGTVLQVYDKVAYVDVEDIGVYHKTMKIPANVPAPEDLPLAHKYKELHDAGRDCDIPYTAMELTTVVAEAIRMCNLENGPEYFEMDLTGVRLGSVALVGIPGEPFTDIGVSVKEAAEGFDLIMPCALTNGSYGYFPMKSAYDEGGYEARSSKFKAGVAEKIIAYAKELLGDMKG
ncbi:MAG: neutral/alkaline non-lysosomal ceramidase N-terminal domain-containing protein [Clostridia bacterium]|nr:neutral/alkaline non-lysosomal ceramidase N-terminal domain-containing protein [Clostridia bacterium]MBQ8552537.1 neutral/alkaline non-lysosomal ceramidase N-terminal domain-containing protein [Clostridia bacterium]